jgi:phosphoesterase RecJ-like protein
MAADLIAAGVDVHETYRRLYEGVPEPKLALLTRALTAVERYDEGRLTLARLAREDFAETGAEESYTEGIIDHLRSVQGTKVAALARELTAEDQAGCSKVSLRATDGDVDVSLIARVQGGGGHRQAAGFATTMDRDELVAFLRTQVAEQLAG